MRLFKVDEGGEIFDAGYPEYGDVEVEAPAAFRVFEDVVAVTPDDWEEDDAMKWLRECGMVEAGDDA